MAVKVASNLLAPLVHGTRNPLGWMDTRNKLVVDQETSLELRIAIRTSAENLEGKVELTIHPKTASQPLPCHTTYSYRSMDRNVTDAEINVI